MNCRFGHSGHPLEVAAGDLRAPRIHGVPPAAVLLVLVHVGRNVDAADRAELDAEARFDRVGHLGDDLHQQVRRVVAVRRQVWPKGRRDSISDAGRGGLRLRDAESELARARSQREDRERIRHRSVVDAQEQRAVAADGALERFQAGPSVVGDLVAVDGLARYFAAVESRALDLASLASRADRLVPDARLVAALALGLRFALAFTLIRLRCM